MSKEADAATPRVTINVTIPDVTIKVPAALRQRLAKIAERMYIHGRRCHTVNGDREVQPRQSVIIEAALEVASRHAPELAQEVMRRTDARAEAGHDFYLKANGGTVRPR